MDYSKVALDIQEFAFPSWKETSVRFWIDQFDGFEKITINSIQTPDGFTAAYVKDEVSLPCSFTITYKALVDGLRRNPLGAGRVHIEANVTGKKANKMILNLNVSTSDSDIKPQPEESKCYYCSRIFSDTNDDLKPRILSCGHTLCSECIYQNADWRKVCINEIWEKQWKVECKKCRMTSVHNGEHIPENYCMKTLISDKKEEALKAKPQSAKELIVMCYEDKDHEARVYCNECEEAYCSKCFITAHIPKIMADHTSIPLRQRPIVVPTCEKCQQREAVFACLQSDCRHKQHKFVCNRCKHNNHKKHDGRKIEEFLEENEKILIDSQEKITETHEVAVKFLQEADAALKSFRNPQEVERQIQSSSQPKKERALKNLKNFQRDHITKIRIDRDVLKSVMDRQGATIVEIEKKLKRKIDLHDVTDLTVKADDLLNSHYLKEDFKFVDLKDFDMNSTSRPKPVPQKKPCIGQKRRHTGYYLDYSSSESDDSSDEEMEKKRESPGLIVRHESNSSDSSKSSTSVVDRWDGGEDSDDDEEGPYPPCMVPVLP